MDLGMMFAERYGSFEAGQRTTLGQFFPDLASQLSWAAALVADLVESAYAAVQHLVLAYGEVVPWWILPSLIIVIAMSITVSRARTLK